MPNKDPEKERRYQRLYREKNREQLAEKKRCYYQENREKILERVSRRQQEKHDEYLEYQRKHYRENREELLEQKRRWQRENRSYRAEYMRRWRAENLDTVRGKERAKKATRKRNVPFTREALEYAEIILLDPCSYCGEEASTIDHIVPVAKGGNSEWSNLTPACVSCNSSKRDKQLLEFILYRAN